MPNSSKSILSTLSEAFAGGWHSKAVLFSVSSDGTGHFAFSGPRAAGPPEINAQTISASLESLTDVRKLKSTSAVQKALSTIFFSDNSVSPHDPHPTPHPPNSPLPDTVHTSLLPHFSLLTLFYANVFTLDVWRHQNFFSASVQIGKRKTRRWSQGWGPGRDEAVLRMKRATIDYFAESERWLFFCVMRIFSAN